MSQVFMVRHQAAGILADYVFEQYPNELQLAAIKELSGRNHGSHHPKPPHEPYWLRVVAIDVLSPKDVPALPEPRGTSAGAELNIVSAHGVGTVTPKKEG